MFQAKPLLTGGSLTIHFDGAHSSTRGFSTWQWKDSCRYMTDGLANDGGCVTTGTDMLNSGFDGRSGDGLNLPANAFLTGSPEAQPEGGSAGWGKRDRDGEKDKNESPNPAEAGFYFGRVCTISAPLNRRAIF